MRASSLLENTVWRLVVLPTEIGGDLTWRAFQQISLEGLSSTLFLFAMSNIFLSKHEGKKKKKKKRNSQSGWSKMFLSHRTFLTLVSFL